MGLTAPARLGSRLLGSVVGGVLDRVLPVVGAVTFDLLDRGLEAVVEQLPPELRPADPRRVYIDGTGRRVPPPRAEPIRLR